MCVQEHSREFRRTASRYAAALSGRFSNPSELFAGVMLITLGPLLDAILRGLHLLRWRKGLCFRWGSFFGGGWWG